MMVHSLPPRIAVLSDSAGISESGAQEVQRSFGHLRVATLVIENWSLKNLSRGRGILKQQFRN
jgi:hypothetical protein